MSDSLNTDHNTGTTVIANYSSNNIGKEMSPDNTRNDDESNYDLRQFEH
jgi:hypothetical protein